MGHRSAAPARAVRAAVVESLEVRQMLTVAVTAAIPDASVNAGAATGQIDLSQYFSTDAAPGSTLAFFQTVLGTIPVQLTDAVTPKTVENFLKYVNAGRYNDTIIHRKIDDFVAQGGGFTAYNSDHVPQFDPVVNEFQPGVTTNVRGTIAMAKVGGDPNSATSEWFFNLADNRSNLDGQNGGFTTFGSVTGGGLGVLDAIQEVPDFNGGGAFANIPLRDFDNASTPTAANYVTINRVTTGASYTVAVDNPGVLGVDVFGSTLAYTPKGAGVANVTVTATGVDGQSVSDTFQVSVGAQVVRIGKGGAKQLTFRAAQGGTVTIGLTGGGTADVTVGGANTAAKKGSKGTIVTGSGLALAGITVTGTGSGSRLSIKSGGTLTSGGTLSIARKLGTLDAPRTVFNGAVSAADALGKVTVKTLAGTWTVARGAKLIKAEGADAAWVGTFGGSVDNLDVRRTLGGALTAASAGTVKVGKLANGSLTLTRSTSGTVLKRLDVGGSIASYNVVSAGGVGDVVSKGAMTDSSVRVGLKGGLTRATTLADFARPAASIKSLTIKATRNAFVNSSIVAGRVGKVALGTFNSAPAGAAFVGVQGDRLDAVTGKIDGKKFTIKKANDQASIDAQLDQQGVAPKAPLFYAV